MQQQPGRERPKTTQARAASRFFMTKSLSGNDPVHGGNPLQSATGGMVEARKGNQPGPVEEQGRQPGKGPPEVGMFASVGLEGGERAVEPGRPTRQPCSNQEGDAGNDWGGRREEG